MSIGNMGMSEKIESYATYSVSDKGKSGRTYGEYGKTIGDPTLSEEGKKYYEELKQKYSNMDFVLVSRDMKDRAQAQAASYANPAKMVVLIDEDKIERMATDEAYRKKYEAIISGATNQLAQVKKSISSTGADVLGFGMQVNDSGLPYFFAVLKTSSAAQKARIEKKTEEKRAEKMETKKKAVKEAEEERIEEKRSERKHIRDKDRETVTIEADSIEELAKKNYGFYVFRKSQYDFVTGGDKIGTAYRFSSIRKIIELHYNQKGCKLEIRVYSFFMEAKNERYDAYNRGPSSQAVRRKIVRNICR